MMFTIKTKQLKVWEKFTLKTDFYFLKAIWIITSNKYWKQRGKFKHLQKRPVNSFSTICQCNRRHWFFIWQVGRCPDTSGVWKVKNKRNWLSNASIYSCNAWQFQQSKIEKSISLYINKVVFINFRLINQPKYLTLFNKIFYTMISW